LSTKPFVKVNCAALPAELIKNCSATEAHSCAYLDGLKLSSLTAAIFLYEIGEPSMAAQAKLLQVLQDGRSRDSGAMTKSSSSHHRGDQ
jgi:transcriptional regulator with GAF, ATPase, and Fis domain